MSKIHYGNPKPVCNKLVWKAEVTDKISRVNCKQCLYKLGLRDTYAEPWRQNMVNKEDMREFKKFMGKYYDGWK